MADMKDYAVGIWKQLDKMAEEDPENYQKFVKDTLSGSKEFFSRQKPGVVQNLFGPLSGIVQPKEENIKDDKGCGDGKTKGPTNSSKNDMASSSKLSDGVDAFNLSSLLSSICTQKDDQETEADEEILKNLKIPGKSNETSAKRKNKKPLIEEL